MKTKVQKRKIFFYSISILKNIINLFETKKRQVTWFFIAQLFFVPKIFCIAKNYVLKF